MALALGALLLVGCVADDGGETDEAALDSAALAQPQGPQPGALTDAQIVHIVNTANAADSAGGELAQTKAADAAVKAFGRRMITDHGTNNQQATQLAQGAALTPEDNPVSQQLVQTHEQATQQLEGLSGAAFDRAYIDHEVQMHQTLLDALDQQLIPAAQNAQLRQHLESTRAAVQSHLEMARGIQGQLGTGAAGQGTSPDTGTGQ